MTRFLLAALFLTAKASSAAPLTVVEDHGGVSALPYYQALQPQASHSAQPIATPPAFPSADAERAMLPVHSTRLSPGDEPRRAIQAPGLAPLFLVGDDDRSQAWLRRRGPALQGLHAVGLVVNVASPQALDALRRRAPGLTLSPVSGDDLAQRLGIHHYPLLVTARGIEQ